MYIKFSEIELNNFGSVGSAKFSVIPGITHVDGINLDNNSSKSNGSGKSTLFSESFRWIIYGSTAKRMVSDGVINDKFDSNCYGILKASIIDDSNYEFPVKIERYRKHKSYGNTIKFTVDGREETKQTMALTQAEIERVFRLPLNVFSSVYLMEQGLDSKFTSLSNVDSKNYIESLRNVKVWDTAFFRTSAKLKKLNSEHSDKKAILNQNEAVANSKGKEIFETEEAIANLTETYDVEKIKKDFLSKKSKYLEDMEVLEKVENYINFHTNLIDQEKPDLEIKRTKKVDKEREIRPLEDKILTLEKSIGALTCFSCGRDFENREEGEAHAKKDIQENETKLKVVSEELECLERHYLVSYNAVAEKLKALSEVKKKYNDKNFDLGNQKSNLERLANKSKEYTIKKDTYQETRDKLSKSKTEILAVNALIRKDLEELEHELPYYKELVSIFSFKGIRSYLISTDIEFLNERMREFSTILFSDMIIQLYPQTNKEGMVTTLDTLGMLTTGIERIYSKLSGGEKRRADICVQLAIREFVRKIYNVNTNLFSLDEVFEGLDEDGVRNVMELVGEVSDPATAIYVISHRVIPQFSGKHITVQKENGISSVLD